MIRARTTARAAVDPQRPPGEPHPLDHADEPEALVAGRLDVESLAVILDVEPEVTIDLPQ